MEQQKKSSADTQLMSLQTVPQHLAGKGLSSIDYGICVAREQNSIGKMLISSDFEVNYFLDEVGKTFMQIIGDLGIKTLPDKAGEKRIIHYITNYYKDLSIAEIKKAFELAIVGELEIEIEHYNSFDLKYICKILNKYRQRRSKAIEALNRATIKHNESEITPERKADIRQEFLDTICKSYQDFCDDKPFNMFAIPMVYDTLVEIGVLHYRKSKKKKIYQRAERKYKKQLSRPKSRAEKNVFKDILENYDKKNHSEPIIRIAKELALMDFLYSCKAKKVDLSQKLSTFTQKQSKVSSIQSKTT